MAAKKHVTTHRTDRANAAADRTDAIDRTVEDESLRHAGVENTAPNDKARQAVIHNEENHRNPPPLQHVDPTTGQVLDRPFTAEEPNRLTIPGPGPTKNDRD